VYGQITVLTGLLILSLSARGKAQGNLVFNGGFDTSAAGWTLGNGANQVNGCVLPDTLSPSPSSDPTASQTIGALSTLRNQISGYSALSWHFRTAKSFTNPLRSIFASMLKGAGLLAA
jgi:hypothetical protein